MLKVGCVKNSVFRSKAEGIADPASPASIESKDGCCTLSNAISDQRRSMSSLSQVSSIEIPTFSSNALRLIPSTRAASKTEWVQSSVFTIIVSKNAAVSMV